METTDHSVAHTASLALTGDGFKTKLSSAEQITREIFLSEVVAERVEDPEIEGHVFYLMRFKTNWDLNTVAERRYEWYARTWQALGEDCRFFHLAVEFAK